MSRLKWRSWSLVTKLTLVMVLMIVITVASTTLFSIRREQQSFRTELQQQAGLLLLLESGAVADPLHNLDVASLQELMAELVTEEIVISARVYDETGIIIADAFESALTFGLDSDPFGQRLVESNAAVYEWQPDHLLAGRVIIVGNRPLGAVSVGLSTAPLEAKLTAIRNQGFGVALATAVVGSLLVLFFSRSITNPLHELVRAARSIAEGNLEYKINVTTGDELATLANTFNSMTAQLSNSISSLEQRVADRTQALATSAEVSRHLSTILDLDELVAEVVAGVRDAFQYYHVQIYLFDAQKEDLALAGSTGTGEAGRQMLAAGYKIHKDRGFVGRAASTNQVILIPDVSQDEIWLFNDLLPDTKSEIAIPIAVGNDVIGVLDVQHDVVNGLDEESAKLLQSIAHQVAIAIQNARQVAQTEAALAETDRLFTLAEEQAQRLVALNELSASFHAAKDSDEVYSIACSQISNIIAGDRVSIALTDTSGETFEILALGGEEGHISIDTQLPLADTAVGKTIRENRLIRLPLDMPLSDFVDTRKSMADGMQSVMTAPLVAGGEVFGSLNVGSKRPYAFQDTDINFIRQIVTLLATTIESHRLGDQAHLLASIVENHPDFIGVGSLEGHALYVNPSGLRMMGLPLDTDTTQMVASDFFLDKDADILTHEAIPNALENGSWASEAGLVTTNGPTVPVEETVGINYDANNQPVSFSITMRDITERKQTEEIIRQSEQTARDFQEKLTRLHEISVELSEQEDLNDVFLKAIELGRNKLDFDRLGLWLFDETVSRMRGTYGTDGEGNVCDESHLQTRIADNPWIVPVLESKERRQVLADTDLVYDDQTVGSGWHIMTILQQEDLPIGWLTADNLINQRPLQSYEPELMSLFTATLASVIVDKRAEAALAKQAAELQAVAEISQIATTILNQNELLQRVTDLTKEQFNLYHAHIYLLSQDKQNLFLAAGAGEVGQKMLTESHKIPLRQQRSLVARAARSHQGVITNDVQAEAGFLPNPHLPDTRSELATPLIAGEEVLGVLDIQASKVNYFSENDINIQTTLAGQIATALQNANQYQRAQEALEKLTRMQQMLSHKGWEMFLTSREKPLQGYLYDQHKLQPIQSNGPAVSPDDPELDESTGVEQIVDDTAVLSPLTIAGSTIGTLGVRDPSGKPVPPHKQRLLTSISQQVAEALERARLFEETEIARGRTEQALSETQRRAAELATINVINEVASSQLDLSALLNSVGSQLHDTLDAQSLYIALYDEATDTISFPYYVDIVEGARKVAPTQLGSGEGGFTAQIIESKRPLLVNAFTQEAIVQKGGQVLGSGRMTDTYLGVPMILGNTLLGVIGANAFREVRVYNEQDQNLLMTLVAPIAVSIVNAQQFERTRRQAERERIVNEITQKIQSTISVEKALQTAVQELGDALSARHTTVELTLPSAKTENGDSRRKE
ncbi:MAG: GAF domain-containing protein [Chloroflexi bacterium]|nr:GAF domain-containing protein [Chloroflexota bacterium]